MVEHITTADAADFVQSQGAKHCRHLTVQHLAYNRNHLLVGGVHPHLYCLPVLKRNTRKSTAKRPSAATPVLLGTDSAHTPKGKENALRLRGCFVYAAIELYAEVFEDLGALDKLEAFCQLLRCGFHGLPCNKRAHHFGKTQLASTQELPFGPKPSFPLRAGETLRWQLEQ